MTKLEQIEFENLDNFKEKLNSLFSKQDIFRTYTDREGKVQRKLLGRNGRLFFENGFSLDISTAENGKVYLSLSYFGVDDRIRFHKMKQEKSQTDKLFD